MAVISEFIKGSPAWREAEHPRSPHTGRFVRVFAFGSNLDPAMMGGRAPGTRVVGPAELPGHKLTFPNGMPNVEASEIESVPGMLYDVPEEEIDRLDRMEGTPTLYQRRSMQIKGGGKADVYQLTDPKGDDVGGSLYQAAQRGRKIWGLPELPDRTDPEAGMWHIEEVPAVGKLSDDELAELDREGNRVERLAAHGEILRRRRERKKERQSKRSSAAANPKTARKWPVGTKIKVTQSGWTGKIERVLPATSGSGAVRIRWDEESRAKNKFAPETSVISNPSLVLEKIED